MSRAIPIADWRAANQRHLTAALDRVRQTLQAHAAASQSDTHAEQQKHATVGSETMPAPPALERLCEAFELSAFERDIVLLCAGMELDSRFAALCAAAQDNPQQPYPTLGLALAALPQAHWSALTPAAPLRHWRLVELDGTATTTGRLRIDERILHFLAGTPHLDEALVGFVTPAPPGNATLAPSQQHNVQCIEHSWTRHADGQPLPVIQLCGAAAGKQALAAAACARLNLNLFTLAVDVLPDTPHEFEILQRLWTREAILGNAALLIEADDNLDATRARRLRRFVDAGTSPLFVAAAEHLDLRQRASLSIEIRKPTRQEQRDLWQQALGTRTGTLNGQIDALAAQFNLDVVTIQAIAAQACTAAQSNDADALQTRLWSACRTHAGQKLGGLARRVEPAATWDDLILPEPQLRTLRDITVHVRQRVRVHETWGFADKSMQGLGITALFSGPSGTGKTLAAEVLAHTLGLDLFHLDLSQVVSKYIGETEKNIGKVFDAAEDSGAVLLFDEADALFGKRSKVKDSHDRYANIEVSYLLQRMEAYRGLALLTTNLKNALDDAFQRRLRFVVSFPFPDATLRAAIWRRIFPPQTPTQDLDCDKLAQLNATGGIIRNVALHAAFAAADADEPIQMKHLLAAVHHVSGRQDKPVTEREIRGWT